MNEIITALTPIFQSIGFVPILAIIWILAMYFFWRESMIVHKDKNSVFDSWVFVSIFMVLWGRITYLLANWESFASTPWSYLPYEKYGDQVFIFRLLPWKFFSVWDGGFLFTGIFMGFIVSAFFYVTFIKKWPWKDMLMPIIVSSQAMLGMTFFVYGVFQADQNISFYGVLLIVFVILLKLVQALIHRRGKNTILLTAIYTVLSTGFISYIFLDADVTVIDKVSVIITLLVSSFIAYMYYVEHLRKPSTAVIHKVSSVRPVNISPNKPIKIRIEQP